MLNSKTTGIDKETKERIYCNCQLNIAIVLKGQNEHKNAVQKFQQLAKTSSAKRSLDIQSNILANIAICFDDIKDFKTALHYGQEEQKLRKSMNDPMGEANAVWENCK